MATNYEKYCIGVRKFLPEHIPLICEDCFNDWSHDCERCDAIFDPEYYKPKVSKVEKRCPIQSCETTTRDIISARFWLE